jgi:decaprenylphospho-beta-D-erythro-pentofuranosid-2-ulose 2-reductase
VNKSVLIIGATSGIAHAVARRYAAQGAQLFLVARNSARLVAVSADLVARGAKEAQILVMDAADTQLIPAMLDSAWDAYGTIDVALVAHGTLPDQTRTEADIPYAIAQFRINAESVIACLAALAPRFEKQGNGVIAVIGSVAGDRGRRSNYLYGSAKAAIEAFASGLRARLLKSGVHVLTIKPGFVATPMTAHLDLPYVLTASADSVALNIEHAITKHKDVLYTPWFWAFIMSVICLIPEKVFKRIRI